MEVILRQDVPNVGKPGDKVKVADGFARNYLLPKGLAFAATSSNAAVLDHERRMDDLRRAKEVRTAKDLARRIKKLSCTIPKQVGENEKLFGSVTSLDIVKALEGEGIVIDKRQIELEEPIRTLGIYPVLIRIHPEVEARLKVWVVKA